MFLKASQAFRQLDEYDLVLRKNAARERESKDSGRRKDVAIKQRYLDQVPSWAKTMEIGQ